MTRQHISEVELCDDTQSRHRFAATCENLHLDDFCLLCGYELQGDRLYMEIHGDTGWEDGTRDIDSRQPYACMECANQFHATVKPLSDLWRTRGLKNFIKEKKK